MADVANVPSESYKDASDGLLCSSWKTRQMRPRMAGFPLGESMTESKRRHDAKRRATQPWRKWYTTKAWRSIKERRKAADPLCRKCLLVGRNTLTTIVDHIKPHRGDRALFFCYENTQGLCKTCHDSDKQQEERLGYSTAIDPETGWPIDERHPANAPS